MSKDPLMAFPGHLQAAMKDVSRGLDERDVSVMVVVERLAQRDAAAKSAVATICNALANLVRAAAANVFTATVDYGKRLSAVIKAGKYDWVNSDITEKNFPATREEGTEEVAFELVHFNRVISSDGALAEMYKVGLRPATLEELLAFGAKYPEEQRKYPVVALGSVWRHLNDRHVPILGSGSVGRYLHLDWFGDDRNGDYRFLAVRK